ncbi:MAG: hypothetical protein DRN83_01455 [Hadesarchaea archaeon]|nr:MAG: hypothetical protein DRN83_01455 [Hadesarchaea archaeon]
MYPASGISPHPAHLAWARSVGAKVVETPMGVGRFDRRKIEGSDVLLLESLYCAPFARSYKREHPECRVVCIIADTSFWGKKLGVLRRIYYWRYLGSVDGFIAVSERIRKDIGKYVDEPALVVRPFLVNKFRRKRSGFNRRILFVGNEVKEKGFDRLVGAMRHLPDFELFLVGDCYKKIRSKMANVHVEGRVPILRPYFEKCSIYAHPADFDPCPSSVWEAMYAGLLPVISEGVGQSELFHGNLKRLVLRKNDPESIANKIREVHEMSGKTKLIKRCMDLASRYTKEKSIKDFKRAFSRLLEMM